MTVETHSPIAAPRLVSTVELQRIIRALHWLLPALAAVAFALSYSALHDLAVAAHVDGVLAWIYPLPIDLVAVCSALTIYALYGAKAGRFSAWLILIAFLAVSVWGNGLHAVGGGLVLTERERIIISAVPPVAIAVCLHLVGLVRRHLGPAAERSEIVIPTEPRPVLKRDVVDAALRASGLDVPTARAALEAEGHSVDRSYVYDRRKALLELAAGHGC